MLGALFAAPFAYVIWQFVTDGGRWRGVRAATACSVLGLPVLLGASLLAFKHAGLAFDGSPQFIMGPIAAAIVIFRIPVDDRRVHTTARNGPAIFSTLMVFGLLFAGLIWWRSDTYPAPPETAQMHETRTGGPISGPTWEAQLCDAARTRAEQGVFRANLRNQDEFDREMVLTPDDIDAAAFGPSGFDWYIDESGDHFTLYEGRTC